MKNIENAKNKNIKPGLIIAIIAIVITLAVAISNIAKAYSAKQNYALTNQRLINILNTQSQQSGELILNIKSKPNQELAKQYVIVNPKIAQFSKHYFKLDPSYYYTQNYVYYAGPKTKKHPARNWGRIRVNDRDDLHWQFQRILMNSVTGLNSEEMLSHKQIAENSIKFDSKIELFNVLKNKPVVVPLSGSRTAHVRIKNNARLRELARNFLADILGSGYTLNFALAPSTIKIKNATADLKFKQNFKTKDHTISNPMSAPVKDLSITYQFTAQFPNQAGKTVIRKINITVQNLGRHKNMAVPKRVIDSATKTNKKYAKQKQN